MSNVCVLCVAEVKKEAEEGDEPQAETESDSEEELSCFAPTVSQPCCTRGPWLISVCVCV